MQSPSRRRFERIARDLEKLPCELHEGVLCELEFKQLIHLSKIAGPRLTWSLSNSLAPWGAWFRDAEMVHEWQRLLDLTDRVKERCRLLFPFLNYQSAHWNVRWSYQWNHGLTDCTALLLHWRDTINENIADCVGHVFDTAFTTQIQPWVAALKDIYGRRAGILDKMRDVATRRDLSIGEMSTFVEMYQELRRIRAEAFAAELNLLADMYEKHPTRLKQPFAPQTRRYNEKHVPNRLRIDACKTLRLAKNGRWCHHHDEPCPGRFRYQFPALISYDYCTQLCVSVLPNCETNNMSTDVSANFRLISARPSWVPATAVDTDPMINIMDALQALGVDEASLANKRNLDKRRHYGPHDQSKLKWLDAFSTVQAWMEETFPEVVEEVRGGEWAEKHRHRPAKEAQYTGLRQKFDDVL